jgi:hypothetical protein
MSKLGVLHKNGVRFSTPNKYIGRYDALLITNLTKFIQPFLFVSTLNVVVYVLLGLSYS